MRPLHRSCAPLCVFLSSCAICLQSTEPHPTAAWFAAVEANDVERVEMLLSSAPTSPTDGAAPDPEFRFVVLCTPMPFFSRASELTPSVRRRPRCSGAVAIANPSIRNEQGNTALHLAAVHGHAGLARVLLKHRLVCNLCQRHILISADSRHGPAMSYGRVDPNAATRHGATALALAAQYNHADVVALLMGHPVRTHRAQGRVSRAAFGPGFARRLWAGCHAAHPAPTHAPPRPMPHPDPGPTPTQAPPRPPDPTHFPPCPRQSSSRPVWACGGRFAGNTSEPGRPAGQRLAARRLRERPRRGRPPAAQRWR